ncbi:MAG: hypothetical protein K6U87_08395 [Firmicutes bacterium]|nr:hypothetical protein [Bacillota bacterium]
MSVDCLLLTHLHSDHTLGYGALWLGGWAWGRSRGTVVGPVRVERFHGEWQRMYADDVTYRLGLGRPAAGLTEQLAFWEVDGAGGLDVGPWRVDYLPVPHGIPAFAYRITAPDGQVVVVSGDTAYYPPLGSWARDCDLLIHEAALAVPRAPNAQWERLADYLRPYHATPREAAEIALRAQASHLVLTHWLPEADPIQARADAASVFPGPIAVAEDGWSWGSGA